MTILVLILGFFLGVLISSLVSISPLVAVFFMLISLAILLAEKIQNSKISKEIIYLSLIVAALGFGILRYGIKDFHEPQLEAYVDKKVELTGIVASEPEKREQDTRFVLKSIDPSTLLRTEKILVSTDLYSDIKYGDEIKASGKLKKPGIIDEDDERQFDYAKYLSKDDIYYTMSFAKTVLISKDYGNKLLSALLSIKEGFIEKTRSILAEPESSLLAGLVISGKDALSKNILEEFRHAGVIHIVVLSGFNITIIAKFFMAIFGAISISLKSRRLWIPRLAVVAGIVGFVLMAGATPSIVRAAIMALVVVGGELLHRQYNVTRALIFAAFIMLLWNPKILVFDPSFQLSFLATIGMIYVTPLVSKRLIWIPERFGLREIIAITLATQITVLPFLVYSMGNFSVVSLFANVLILPLVPITMLLGFFATVISFLAPFIALPITYISHLLLAWILFVARFFGEMKYASIGIRQFSIFWMFLVYAVMILAYSLPLLKRLLPGSGTSLYKGRLDP